VGIHDIFDRFKLDVGISILRDVAKMMMKREHKVCVFDDCDR
jgi:hypothetical protein